jgi:LPS export ABC transporter permease LptG
MAMEGRISPFLGMWGPNILFFLAGAYLFARAARESPLLGLFSRLLGKRGARMVLIRVPVSPRAHKGAARRRPRLQLRFPNILDRYMTRKYIAIFFLVFLALLLISIIVTFFERIDNVYEHNKSLSLLFRYIQYRIPEFAHYIFPVAVLATTLLTLGLMTKSNEITAMKACGISVYRLILPVVFIAGLVSVFSFGLQERVLPSANKRAEEIWNRINDLPARSYSFLGRRWVLGRDKSRIYHYSYYEPASSAFSQISIFDVDPRSWLLQRRLYAEKGRLEGTALTLVNGWSRSFGGERESRFETFAETGLRLEEGANYFVKESTEPDLMSFRELKEYTADVEQMGFETTRFRVDLYTKLSFPLVSLIMALLAVPFAFSMGKRGALVGLGLSVAIAMIYWGTLGVFRGLGYVGFLSAFLSSWGPNLLFCPLSLYLLFRLRT